MADNYLENKFEEVFGRDRKKTTVRKNNPSLETLLQRNRSYRGYDNGKTVTFETLETIVRVNSLVASSRNRQALRFKLVTKETGAEDVLGNMRLGGALPELHLPFPGTEPEAFIIVCSTIPEDNDLFIDLGISLQSMLLKAVEIGLNGIIVRSFNREALAIAFELEIKPLAILAIGKGAESIFLRPIREGEPQSYYRKDGIQYVPKLGLDDLVI